MSLEGLSHLIQGLESQESWRVQRQFRSVLANWPKSVGFAVARKTRPTGIQRDVLYVATETAAWAQTLSYERYNILKKLNQHQRQPLKGIRFSTAQWARPASVTPTVKSNHHHPSYIGHVPTLSKDQTAPTEPIEVFNRWAAAMQEMQTSQAVCPQCRCRCPQGEIARWTLCALCAAKNMK